MKLFILCLLLIPFALKAEDIKFYKATNGITYHTGDTVKLGRGSAQNGSFQYVNVTGFFALAFKDPHRDQKGLNAPHNYNSNNAVIKKIKVSHTGPDANRVTFVVSISGPSNYNLFIEDAIATCEVSPCLKAMELVTRDDKFDQLKKLKALFDSGAITKEEYEAEKKKLLN